ncbi:MAG: hypothetical protein AB8B85_23865, partial [Paracoccaceae bacterium]
WFRISCSSSLLDGYDEPEILLMPIPHICPKGADVRQGFWSDAIASDVAKGAITKVRAKDEVAFHDHLRQVTTMHAVIAKTHPRREKLLATLNSGLDRVKKSEDWFGIISRYLPEHRSNTRP